MWEHEENEIEFFYEEAISKGIDKDKLLHYIMQAGRGHLNPKTVKNIIEKKIENEYTNSKSTKN